MQHFQLQDVASPKDGHCLFTSLAAASNMADWASGQTTPLDVYEKTTALQSALWEYLKRHPESMEMYAADYTAAAAEKQFAKNEHSLYDFVKNIFDLRINTSRSSTLTLAAWGTYTHRTSRIYANCM